MPATLKLTHNAIGAEVRRGTYDVVVDGERAGSVFLASFAVPRLALKLVRDSPASPSWRSPARRYRRRGVALGPGQNASRKGSGPLPAAGATGSTA